MGEPIPFRPRSSAGAPRPSRRVASRLGNGFSAATILTGLAIALSVSSLFFATTHLSPEVTTEFAGIGSVAALLFYFSQLWVYLARREHPVLEVAVLVLGALMLAVGAVSMRGRVPSLALVTCYWVPGLLALGAAILVGRAHRASNRPTAEGGPVRLRINPRGRRLSEHS